MYEPAGNPLIVPDVPVPVTDTPPGVRVRVHVPVEGNPVSTTLPVVTACVGWVIVPIAGAAGTNGCGEMVTPAGIPDVQPDELVTV